MSSVLLLNGAHFCVERDKKQYVLEKKEKLTPVKSFDLHGGGIKMSGLFLLF